MKRTPKIIRCASPSVRAKMSERMTSIKLPIIGPMMVPIPPMAVATRGSKLQIGAKA